MSTRNVLLFPGQGAQYVGMAGPLVSRSPGARLIFERAREVLGYDLLEICANGPQERLNATDVSQPAIFVSSLAALEDLRATQPHVTQNVAATAGLSLGEYTALAFAEVFGFQEGLDLVKTRGEAMQAAAEATPSGMASILLLDRDKLRNICQDVDKKHGQVSIANYLCPGNLVVSGHLEAVAAVEQVAQAAGGKAIRLSVAGAFHTPIMATAVEKLARKMESMRFNQPKLPVWSNVTGEVHSTDAGAIKALLARQVVEPVMWESGINSILGLGENRFFEVGPGKVLAGLLKRIQRKAECISIPA